MITSCLDGIVRCFDRKVCSVVGLSFCVWDDWGKRQFKAGPPLDLSFWSFLTFLHHGIEEVERHLL